MSISALSQTEAEEELANTGPPVQAGTMTTPTDSQMQLLENTNFDKAMPGGSKKGPDHDEQEMMMDIMGGDMGEDEQKEAKKKKVKKPVEKKQVLLGDTIDAEINDESLKELGEKPAAGAADKENVKKRVSEKQQKQSLSTLGVSHFANETEERNKLASEGQVISSIFNN